jgi:trehalose synthase-fused probable maltokinase
MREEDGRQSRALIEFMKSQRWFGDKGRDIRHASVEDVIPVEWPGSKKTFAVARAKVAHDQGASTYQLFTPGAKGREPEADQDALRDPEFLRGLADAWRQGATFEGKGVRWIVQSLSKSPLVVPPHGKISVSATEQTNSSIILNDEAILKLFRKIEPGEHPDVEVTQFLTIDRKFVHVPALLGTIRFEDRNGVTVAGMLQEFVPGAVDGWTHVLAQQRQPGSPIEKEAEQLGAVTRALHEELASGDPGSEFDLRPATAADVGRWRVAAARTIERSLATIDHGTMKAGVAEEARAIREDALRITARLAQLGDIGTDAGANTRTHGDLHLGQTLRSSAGQFLVIDFEGEPTRPLRDRRARNSPLRDVAGMLRSFSYAAAVGSRHSALGGRAVLAEGRESKAESWENSARAAFLRGYFSETKGLKGLLPRSRDNAERLIRMFELEKAFYELQYELDHRPDWVWVPLRGITQLLA